MISETAVNAASVGKFFFEKNVALCAKKLLNASVYQKNLRAIKEVLIAINSLRTRGGVEDTRLEAKAKDTKKFRSQGQAQTLSRPRTKGTGASVLQKKKIFKNFFQAISKKRSSKFFFIRKRSSKFFSRDFHARKTKKGLCKFPARFLALSNKILTVQKIVLSSSRG